VHPPRHVILCTGEIILLNHRPPHSWLQIRKIYSTEEKRDNTLIREISLFAFLCYTCRNNTSKTPASTAATWTGTRHIRIFYNHVYVSVRNRGSKPGCKATNCFKNYNTNDGFVSRNFVLLSVTKVWESSSVNWGVRVEFLVDWGGISSSALIIFSCLRHKEKDSNTLVQDRR
jgi:hypothetical protein